jgi:hypothetical protein
MLEAFVHDPLINWRLLNTTEAATEAALARESQEAAAAAAAAGAAPGGVAGAAAGTVAAAAGVPGAVLTSGPGPQVRFLGNRARAVNMRNSVVFDGAVHNRPPFQYATAYLTASVGYALIKFIFGCSH